MASVSGIADGSGDVDELQHPGNDLRFFDHQTANAVREIATPQHPLEPGRTCCNERRPPVFGQESTSCLGGGALDRECKVPLLFANGEVMTPDVEVSQQAASRSEDKLWFDRRSAESDLEQRARPRCREPVRWSGNSVVSRSRENPSMAPDSVRPSLGGLGSGGIGETQSGS